MTVTASKFFALPPAAVSPELEARFFSALKTGNATFKKTAVNRFAAVDRVCAELLAEQSLRAPEVLDVGISSGTTTLELKRAFEARGLAPHITGTDQSFEAWLVPGPFGTRALMQPDGHVLQFEVAGRPLRGWDRRLDRLTGRAAFNAALRYLYRNVRPERDGRRVDLVSPHLREGRGIAIQPDDILAPNLDFSKRFDFVRAANILNRDYFSAEQLRAALGHVRGYLKGSGSLLLVIRTDKRDERNHGTLLRLDADNSLRVLRTFGKGSEVADLVPMGQPASAPR